jgi:hypothetical protein
MAETARLNGAASYDELGKRKLSGFIPAAIWPPQPILAATCQPLCAEASELFAHQLRLRTPESCRLAVQEYLARRNTEARPQERESDAVAA